MLDALRRWLFQPEPLQVKVHEAEAREHARPLSSGVLTVGPMTKGE